MYTNEWCFVKYKNDRNLNLIKYTLKRNISLFVFSLRKENIYVHFLFKFNINVYQWMQ